MRQNWKIIFKNSKKDLNPPERQTEFQVIDCAEEKLPLFLLLYQFDPADPHLLSICISHFISASRLGCFSLSLSFAPPSTSVSALSGNQHPANRSTTIYLGLMLSCIM